MTLIEEQAQAIASIGGYSEGRYRDWENLALNLLEDSFKPLEVEALMRSKHTRWCADRYEDEELPGKVPSYYFFDYLNDVYPTLEKLQKEVRELVEGTESLLPKKYQS
jgi:hypothetical protein